MEHCVHYVYNPVFPLTGYITLALQRSGVVAHFGLEMTDEKIPNCIVIVLLAF